MGQAGARGIEMTGGLDELGEPVTGSVGVKGRVQLVEMTESL